MRMAQRLTRAILMLCCAGSSVHGAARAQEATGQEATATQPGSANPLSAIDPSSMTGFSDRPLFSLSRRRPDVAAPVIEETVEAPAESFNVRLLGVIVTPSGAIARLKDLDTDTTESLKKGDMFRDWSVLSIDKSGITLKREGDVRSMTVFQPADVNDVETPM